MEPTGGTEMTAPPEPSDLELWLTHKLAKIMRKKQDIRDRELIEEEGIGLPIGVLKALDE